jgi:hypothetical protein
MSANKPVLRGASSLDEAAFDAVFSTPGSPLFEGQPQEVKESPAPEVEPENAEISQEDADKIRQMFRDSPAGAQALLAALHKSAKDASNALDALDPAKSSEAEMRVALSVFLERRNLYQKVKGFIERE